MADKTKVKYYQLELVDSITGSDLEPSFLASLATKAYVDGIKQSLDIKDSVRVAVETDAPLTPGSATFDGVVITTGERILLMGQTAPEENGIYIFNGVSNPLTRSTDADDADKVTLGLYTYTEAGTNAGKAFVLYSASTNPIVIDTTELLFTQFSGSNIETTDDLPEGLTNFYFTDAKAQAALAADLANKANVVHTHTTTDITNLSSYTGFDSRYYTETEVDTLLLGKSDTSHTHTFASLTSKPTTLSGYGITDAYPLTGNPSGFLTTIAGISAGGELSGTYPNPTLLNSAVIGKVLTGLSIAGSTISATDSILDAFGKLQNQVNGKAATSHTHAAGDITSGVFNTARLGSGTANSTTYLRGDGAWATLPTGITGTLSAGQMPVASGANTLIDSRIYQSGSTFTGIGTGSPLTSLQIYLNATGKNIGFYDSAAGISTMSAFNNAGSVNQAIGINGTSIILNDPAISTGGVGIGTTTVASSALLDIVSTTKGILIPRMTTTNKNAISSPSTGLQLFDTTLGTPEYYNGSVWTGAWNRNGNLGVGPNAFIGTLDTTALVFKVNNLKSGFIDDGTTANTIFGYIAGFFNSGTHNTVFGYAAMCGTPGTNTGSYNTAFGDGTLVALTSGFYNIAVGYQSLKGITTGQSNIGIGVNTVASNAAGIGNIIVGHNSYNSATSGNYNMIFGSLAGGNLTNESNITLIGYGTDIVAASGDNQLNISNIIYGKNLTGANGQIAIGTSTIASSAIFQIDSTTKGILIPRLNTTQQTAISSPVAGLAIYNTTLNNFGFYNGSAWLSVLSNSGLSNTYLPKFNSTTGQFSNSSILDNGSQVTIGLPILASDLVGSGTRMVVASSTGVLSTQTIPGGLSGSLTTGYIPIATSSSTVGDSALYNAGTSYRLVKPYFVIQDTNAGMQFWKDGTPSKAAQVGFNNLATDGLTFEIYDGSGWGTALAMTGNRSVAIGANSTHASAIFQVDSTTKGMLTPRMTTTDRNAISSPATGLMIFNTTTVAFEFYNGSTWASLAGGGGTVTSVGLIGHPMFNIFNSPVTTAGTLDLSIYDQSANTFFAGPSASTGQPTFRTITYKDLPNKPIVDKTAAYTVTTADYTINCTSGTFNVTLLPVSGGLQGRIYVVKNSGAGTITVVPDGSDTIDGGGSIPLSPTDALTIQCTGTAWIII